MRIEVLLPQWGMGISEGTIVKWLKECGDAVEANEPIVEVETAKASDVVSSSVAGVLVEQLADAGTIVPVNAAIAIIDSERDS